MEYREKILELLSSPSYKPLSEEELISFFEIEGKEVEQFVSLLNEMYEGGQVFQTKRNKYVLTGTLGIVTGTLSKHKKGFGFVIPTDGGGDVFVSEDNMKWAMHGDLVAVKLLKGEGVNRRREGAVARIIRHNHPELVGTFYCRKGYGFLVPDDPKLTEDVFVSQEDWGGAQTGDKVVVRITQWPDDRQNAEGVVSEIVSRQGENGGDVKALIRQYNMSRQFPEDVQREADGIDSSLPELTADQWRETGRRDLREQPIITIDGAYSKDFDDAVTVSRLSGGNFLLGVHIADVTHYVREQQPLDREAWKRGTSVYILDQVIPMLPEKLSNGICSLNPGEDRLTLSVNMEINGEGQVVDHEIYESVIRSRERMVYTDVSDMLEFWKSSGEEWMDGQEEWQRISQLCEKYSYLKEMLLTMDELASVLREKRDRRGSVDFDLDEASIALNEDGIPVHIGIAERRVANRIIEEFMLAANETVAEHFYWMGVPFVYRIHEKPTADRISELKRFLASFGIFLKGSADSIHPRTLNEILAQARGMEEENVINTVTLRAMQKAFYGPECLGHFGLGVSYYCHFTSPIRRYPDLMIHRIIKETLGGKLSVERQEQLAVTVREAAEQSSAMERRGQEMEREAEKMKMAEYMSYHEGEMFEGIISGVTNFGFFVQLENTVEGLVKAVELSDDYYDYEPEKYRLIGRRSHKIYGLGDRVTIRVERADPVSREIDFSLAGDSAIPPRQSRGNSQRRQGKPKATKVTKDGPARKAKGGQKGGQKGGWKGEQNKGKRSAKRKK